MGRSENDIVEPVLIMALWVAANVLYAHVVNSPRSLATVNDAPRQPFLQSGGHFLHHQIPGSIRCVFAWVRFWSYLYMSVLASWAAVGRLVAVGAPKVEAFMEIEIGHHFDFCIFSPRLVFSETRSCNKSTRWLVGETSNLQALPSLL